MRFYLFLLAELTHFHQISTNLTEKLGEQSKEQKQYITGLKT